MRRGDRLAAGIQQVSIVDMLGRRRDCGAYLLDAGNSDSNRCNDTENDVPQPALSTLLFLVRAAAVIEHEDEKRHEYSKQEAEDEEEERCRLLRAGGEGAAYDGIERREMNR